MQILRSLPPGTNTLKSDRVAAQVLALGYVDRYYYLQPFDNHPEHIIHAENE